MRRLHNDQKLLGERSSVARAAVGAAQSLCGISVRGEPCRGGPKDCAGQQRQSESKRQYGQRRRRIDRNEVGAMEGERHNELHSQVCKKQACQAAEDRKHQAFGQRLPDQPLARSAERQAN